MKRLLSLFFLYGSLFASTTCVPELKPALNILYRSPDARKVIKEVEKGGSIKIYRASFHGGSNAMWKSDERAIVINTHRQATYGQIARSILFELHNALTTNDFIHLDQHVWNGEMSKNDYVEAIERLEYQNALDTVALIEKGMQSGIFPQDMHWPIVKDFEEHYRIQQQSGHAQGIAASYDYLVDYNRLRYLAWQSQNRR